MMVCGGGTTTQPGWVCDGLFFRSYSSWKQRRVRSRVESARGRPQRMKMYDRARKKLDD